MINCFIFHFQNFWRGEMAMLSKIKINVRGKQEWEQILYPLDFVYVNEKQTPPTLPTILDV